QRCPPRGGALYADRCRPHHVRGDTRGSQGVLAAVEDQHAALSPHRQERQDPGVRVRVLPPGQEVWQRETRRSTAMKAVLSRISAATAVLAFVVTAVPLSAQEKAAAKFVAPRTADNHPGMQGAWARRGVGLQEANGPSSPLGDFGCTGQPYPTVFNTGVSTTQDRSAVQGRPAGVIDPADRVLPWRPEADAARRQFIPKMIPPASLAYVEKAARCVLPGPLEADDRHPYQIIQRPGYFVMMYEYNHVTRVIPTDGRAHVGSNARLFWGDPAAHWEGETLVVDTTNFNDKTSLGRTVPYHSDALHTVERFTRIDPNVLDYQITIEDPKMFTRPIKIAGTFQAADPKTELMEFACAEGSQVLPNVFGFELAPGRAQASK